MEGNFGLALGPRAYIALDPRAYIALALYSPSPLMIGIPNHAEVSCKCMVGQFLSWANIVPGPDFDFLGTHMLYMLHSVVVNLIAKWLIEQYSHCMQWARHNSTKIHAS